MSVKMFNINKQRDVFVKHKCPQNTCNSPILNFVVISKVGQRSRSYIFVYLKNSSHKVYTYEMYFNMRKTVFRVFKDSDEHAQSDKHLCYTLTGNYHI